MVLCDARPPRRPRTGRAGFARQGRQGRQADDEFAALVGPLATGLDGAAVQLDEAPHQRQADAQAPLRSRDGTVGLGEQVEDVRQQLPFDADAVVANPQHGLLTFAAGPSPRYGPACCCTWRRC